ncbi:MAG: glycosyltransferase family 2 protein [Microcoleus sp. PH2017_10_PVI_O_A]|uniref:glycosyltransferase family 2 protein n=1 Tax=unclassified Microcoleus TaxID=2642155 RepID=UPI001DBF3258|nr:MULTISPECIES: glycosyltransferase [unclassified Microcoleus]TAE83445.1 MAG: glycosyltransferase family 2 protein [Oscillatoriales cyanobacterium]MCC3404531.1 glycosyltransferase family 2 protein [Microcoleus sp. PH2017_10_PVI_O_A]MCC3458599.1 glycosyltransferase family 2 protein [Microcoleus sp. PH2017_11_PCY_U_A]MCC3476849.1 glycosyltransferase family 2 protein [Microcoleus sp. PH2017_12_PCY_D_A]MCC3526986.1 glycosyltransferase family 2 protein [Microcoleus sp. PH2017_21_RUC_O_A]
MNRENPTVSVIIPSHNRSSSLRRALDALQSQTYPIDLMEVTVVADNCIDDTLAMLQDYKAPFKLHAIEVNCRSAAIARNTGAASASGELLLFLDDDIEAMPPLVESHVRTHQERPGSAVMGPYPPKLQGSTRYFDVEVRAWWEEKFYQMSRPHHRFEYQDLLSGNLSLDAKLFARLDGFDSAFGNCGGEDYEFGVRLLKADVPFAMAAGAVGYHYEHETNNLDRSFRRARQEGRSDVSIGHRHPELRPLLHIKDYEIPYSLADKILSAVAFVWPAGVDLLAAVLRKSLDVLESLGMRTTWRWLRGKLRGYWYFRGVIDELKTRSAISSFMQGGPARADLSDREIEIDLQQGWEAAERSIDAERPDGIYLFYGELPVGHVPPKFGVEPLRGVHLRSILANLVSDELLIAIAVNGMPKTTETALENPLIALENNYELAVK